MHASSEQEKRWSGGFTLSSKRSLCQLLNCYWRNRAQVRLLQLLDTWVALVSLHQLGLLSLTRRSTFYQSLPRLHVHFWVLLSRLQCKRAHGLSSVYFYDGHSVDWGFVACMVGLRESQGVRSFLLWVGSFKVGQHWSGYGQHHHDQYQPACS